MVWFINGRRGGLTAGGWVVTEGALVVITGAFGAGTGTAGDVLTAVNV